LSKTTTTYARKAMKPAALLLILLIAAVHRPALAAEPPPLSARDLMQKQSEALISTAEQVKAVMLLIDSRGNQQQREVVLLYRQFANGDRRAAVAFTAPASIRGTALVVWQSAAGDKQQWLYMPAVRKYQRVADGARRSSFMGTDFSFEDLEPEDLDAYNYAFLPETVIENRPCHVVEALPKDADAARQSSYSKRVLYICRETSIPVRIEFFDRRDSLVKTQTSSQIEQTAQGYWRAGRLVMETHRTRNRTLLAVTERAIDVDLDEELFSERAVSDGRLLSR